MMKHRFCSESVGDYKWRCALILADDKLTPEQQKQQINEVRLECMGQNRYYSKQMKDLDSFIRTEQERLRWQKQRTARLQRQKAR